MWTIQVESTTTGRALRHSEAPIRHGLRHRSSWAESNTSGQCRPTDASYSMKS